MGDGSNDQVIGLGQIKPAPMNPRKHNPRNIGLIVDSIQRFGFVEPMLLDEDNRIIHGHGRQDAVGEIGMEQVRVIDFDPSVPLALRLRGLSETQKQQLALYLNRSAELATWDSDVLRTLQDEGVDLGPIFTDDEKLILLEQQPSETDWLDAFEGTGPKGDLDTQNMTFAVPKDRIAEVQATLERFDGNKNVALLKIIDAVASYGKQ